MVLQLAVNAGEVGFKRADALDVLEDSLLVNMTKTQKLDYVSNMLRTMMAEGLLEKNGSGRAWRITTKGRSEIE